MQAPDNPQRWKIEEFKDKLRYSLSARFLLRFHAALIIAFTILCAWLADLALLYIGMTSMPFRYGLAVLLGYAAFLLGVHLWNYVAQIKTGAIMAPAS